MPIDFTKSYPLITWDLNKTRNNLEYSLFGKKYDSARGLKVQVVQGEEILTPTDEKLRIYFNKPDGKSVYLESKKIKDGCFIIDFTNQVFAVPGDVFCELELSYGGKQLQSDTFKIKAEKSLKDGSIESKNELVVFIEALEKIETAEEKANLAHQVAQQASELLTQAQNMFTTYETAENARKTAEQNRANAENTRTSNEVQRQQAETARANTFNSFMANISQQFQEKFDNIETEYLTELTEIKEDIEQLESDVDDLQLKVDLAIIDTQSGNGFVQTTVADEGMSVEVVIEGKTVVTPLDPTQDISPDNPATITSVGDEPFDVVSCGVNLLDPEGFKSGYTLNGITMTKQNGVVTLNGTAQNTVDVYVIRDTASSNFYEKASDLYNMISNINAKVVVSSNLGLVYYRSKSKEQYFTTPLPGYDTQWAFIRIPSGTTLSNAIFQVQVGIGSTPTDYEPYKGNKITISSSHRSLPNGLRDTYEFINDKLYKVSKVEYTVITKNDVSDMDVDLTTTTSTTAVFLFHGTRITSKAASVNMYCSHFKVAEGNGDYEHIRFDAASVPRLKVWINKSRLEGWNETLTKAQKVDLFRNWIIANNVIVQYELVNPVYTEAEKISLTTYKGITNILTTASIQPNITAKFLSRLGNFAKVIIAKLDKLTQALLALGGTV